MKFDKILINPPYQSNLHLAFLAEALHHIKADGVCVSLQPTAWQSSSNLKPYARQAKFILKHLLNVESISKTDASLHFPDTTMSSSLGLYVCSRIKSHEEARLPESTISAVAAEQAEAEKDFKHLVDDKVRISLFSQYFTSPALAVKMVEKLGLLEGKDIADIAVGSGNLIAAAVIAGADPKRCYGIELDEKMLALCRKRLRKLGVPERNLVCGSAFDESSYQFNSAEQIKQAVYIELGRQQCTVKYLKLPTKVMSCHKLDLSSSIGKQLLSIVLEDAVAKKLQIVFSEPTTLSKKFKGSVCASLEQLKSSSIV